jgi:DNA polymerase-3 subunit gamma/tau
VAKKEVVVEPPKEEKKNIKVAAFQQFKRKSSLSIGGAIKKKTEVKEEQKQQEDLSNKPRKSFTVEQLHAKWKSYAYRVQKERRVSMYATLSKRQPELKENFEVVFTIDSAVQQIDLDNERPDLLAFLRKELNNYGVSLTIEMTEKEATSMKYLSGRDRFLQMAEKNDALHQLREKLGLDIEY